MTEQQRYFFDHDDSMHWYKIPLARRAEWVAWNYELIGDEIPEFAESLGGHVNRHSFTDVELIKENTGE